MQCVVECDLENHSNYVMCAVNPTFSDAALREVVDMISA